MSPFYLKLSMASYCFKDRTTSHGLKGNVHPLGLLPHCALHLPLLFWLQPCQSFCQFLCPSSPPPGSVALVLFLCLECFSVLLSLFLVFRACLKYSFCMKFLCVSLYICRIKVETIVQETLIPTKTAIHLLKIFLITRRKSSPPIRDVAILPDAYQIYNANL